MSEASENQDPRVVTLTDGLKVGEQLVKQLTLRPPKAGDLIEARAECERPVMTPEGYQLLVSQSELPDQVVRRQVEKIGEDSGPMDMALLKRLTLDDYERLHAHAERLDIAVERELAKRGRDEGPGGARGDG